LHVRGSIRHCQPRPRLRARISAKLRTGKEERDWPLQQFADSTNDERELLPKPSTLGNKKTQEKAIKARSKPGDQSPQARHE
jgi:hypothetical protein